VTAPFIPEKKFPPYKTFPGVTFASEVARIARPR
jgi:hypothetical protein